ncbi:Conserved_hypothetical protein [Hexamita inflata]|uniref:Transmembrane protein n=1 Tax=Hexamita inflata TaxID=28002 RepID=A0ABP1HCG1_9EUKA
MFIAQLILLDILITDKAEIVDCYTAATNIRFVSLNGQRSFRIYLVPTQKLDCSQFPRGMNITVFATQLVDGSNNFIPNSVIIYDFNYASTVGISIPCTQCADDTYFSSDQVIVTMESAIHFTRIVMGAVQTQRGLQVNCFSNAAAIVDFSAIVITTTPSGSCPQLVSADPTKLKNLISADFFIVYETGEIERFEKLVVGTSLLSATTPPAANAPNKYTIAIADIGRKPIDIGFQYIQLQLNFADTGVPIMAVIQASTFQFASFPGAFLNVDVQVQKGTFYFDMVVNNNPVATPFGPIPLSMYYNYLIFNATKCDGFVPQVYAYSSTIPSDLRLAQPFVNKSLAAVERAAPMTFTSPVSIYGFVSAKIQVTCDMVQESDCMYNVDRFLNMKDPYFNMNIYVKFYKGSQMVYAVSQKINKVYDSCFTSSIGFLSSKELTINITKNTGAKSCFLSNGQKVDVMLNFTEYTRALHYANYTFFNYAQLDFSYQMTFPISPEQHEFLLGYLSRETAAHQIFQFVYFKISGKTIDQASFSPLYMNDLTVFKQKAKMMIVYLAVVSVGICAVILMIPVIMRKVGPIIKESRKLKAKIGVASLDKFDL